MTQKFCRKCGSKLKIYYEESLVSSEQWSFRSCPKSRGYLGIFRNGHDTKLDKNLMPILNYDPDTGQKLT